MLHEAGLDDFVAEQVFELVPGLASPEDLEGRTDPCEGAERREHSHFFTADGSFGSRDFRGQQVDDGTYELVGDDVVVINGSSFHYRIDGDAIYFQPDPVDISECDSRMCRFEAAWVLLVAMPGMPWTRGTISAPSDPTAGGFATSPMPTAIALADVPAGRIVFYRLGSDEVEHYFTVNTDGTDEHALFTTEGCGCARLSPDGTQVWTMGATGHGTWSFTTMRPDGTDRVVVDPPIETLNLGPASPSVNGEWIAFNGWDDTDPSRAGVYIASPDLADLRLVTPLPEGTVEAEPFGITPDGSRVLFFADRAGTEHHEGDLYVINADGGGLRQLNPPGTTHNWLNLPGGSLSPDGGQVAFAVDEAVFVADVDGGDARQITEKTGFAWAVSWSPTGEWIVFTRQHGTTSVISLVRPDGADLREVSDQAAGAVWSPNGDALLVARPTEHGEDLWIMDLEGNFIGQVTDEPSTYGSYSWAPAAGS